MSKFEGKVSSMGRKKIINVPVKQKGFKIGTKVEVKEKGEYIE